MKLTKVLIGTNNPGKLEEIRPQFENLNIKTYSLKDLAIHVDFEETGKTFEENAIAKAKFYYGLTKIPTIADDSGLEIDILDGEPGVKSRRWAGHTMTDQEMIDMLFEKLKGVSKEKRTARFVAVSAIYDGKEVKLAKGDNRGYIAESLECEMQKGIPWSAVFYPDGFDKVFSQLSVDEKNKISHRGRALQLLLKKIL